MKIGGVVTRWIAGPLPRRSYVDRRMITRTDWLLRPAVAPQERFLRGAVDPEKWPIFKCYHQALALRRIVHPQPAPAFVAEATQGFDVALENVGGVGKGGDGAVDARFA